MVLLIGTLIYAEESIEKQFFGNAPEDVKEEFIKVRIVMKEKIAQDFLDEKIKTLLEKDLS